ncbi:DUF4365 domain-containing protein [Streptomyces sp. NPDC051452]|uniref:DUF4365 domain-containing protein n=1 Tax=Streptomyces sp. NPDC051452 TaxID=3365654 RepID=UPI00379C46B6
MAERGAELRSAARGRWVVGFQSEVWQGHFAEGLVWALSCAAGLNPGKRALDTDGVDIQIGFPGAVGTMRYPLIEAQVKSCCNPHYVGDSFSYSIPVKNYNDLIGCVGIDLPTRRYLFLVHTPATKAEYVLSTHTSSNFQHAIYWVDIMDHDPIDPEMQSTKRVHVPRQNLLTVDTLTQLVTGEIFQGREAV